MVPRFVGSRRRWLGAVAAAAVVVVSVVGAAPPSSLSAAGSTFLREDTQIDDSPGIDGATEAPPGDNVKGDTAVPFAVNEVAIGIGYDGSGVFDADDTPGNDSSPSNGRVRTQDTVQYRFQYNSLSGLDDPFITSTLPEGMAWESNDPTCIGTGTTPAPSGIYDSVTGEAGGDRRLLVCQLPSTEDAISDEILPLARVLVVPNETVLPVSFTADDASNTPVASDSVEVTVSAAPFYDLRKIYRSGTQPGVGEDGSTPGIIDVFAFGITVAHPTRSGPIEGIKGMAPLASPISFNDDLSEFSPNARLWDWGNATEGCAPILGGGIIAPISKVGSSPGATETNAVPDSGAIECTPTPEGFEVTLTGTDTLGTSFPTRTSAGGAIPNNSMYVATGLVYVWYPASDVVDAGGTLRISNTFNDFDPDDVTGQSNYGEGSEALEECFGRPGELCNNTYTFNQAAGMGYAKAFRDYRTGGIPDGASGVRSGDLAVGIGARVRGEVTVSPRVVPAQNVVLCDVFDSSSQRLAPWADGSTPARFSQTTGGSVRPGGYVIEFGAPVEANRTFADARESRCDDEDALWSTDPADEDLGGEISPNGYRDSIDRVRVRFTTALGPEANYTLYTALEVYSQSEMDPQANPGGAIAANFGQVREGAAPTWRTNTFDPVTFSGNGLGDRAVIASGQVRVAKVLEEAAPGSGTQILAGQRAYYEISPRVTMLGGTPATLSDVIVTDILPTTSPRMSVDPLAVTRPDGVGVEFCNLCDGSDWSGVPEQPSFGVRWLFGDVEAGTELPTLRLGVFVPLEAKNGQTYTNAAVISSPGDSSSETLRTAQAGLTIAAPTTLLATKSAPQSVRPLSSDLTWTLSFRNASTVSIDRLDVVDILPFGGDQREPESQYTGGWDGVRTSGLPAGLNAFVTSEDPVTLDERDGTRDGVFDPGRESDPWYEAPGTGAWQCALEQLGVAGCPSAADVTAVRFASTDVYSLPPASTSSWDLTLAATGNASGNVYSNQFMARTAEAVLLLPVRSPAIPIKVTAPKIAISKEVCTQIECPVDDQSVWAKEGTVPMGTEVKYRLTVENVGPEPGHVAVTDVMPDGQSFVTGSAVPSRGDVENFPSEWVVGQMDPGESATLLFAAVTSQPGEGRNEATAQIADRFDQRASDRDEVVLNVVEPDIVVEKDVASVEHFGSGRTTVSYIIAVTNRSVVDSEYSLRDAFAFGEGLVVDSVDAGNITPGTVVTNPAFDGGENQALVEDEVITAGSRHEFRVTVAVTRQAGVATANAVCQVDGTPGGFRNHAILETGEQVLTDSACVDAPVEGAPQPAPPATGPGSLAQTGAVVSGLLLGAIALALGAWLVSRRRKLS